MHGAEPPTETTRSRASRLTGPGRRPDCEPGSPQRLPGLRGATHGVGGFRRVAVAIDDLGLASEALEMAAFAVDPAAGHVRLIHVRQWQLQPVPSRAYGALAVLGMDLFVETSEHAMALIDDALREIHGRGVQADGIVVEARQPLVGAAILDAATAWDAELIVVGRNPRRLLGSLFWRRISDQVIDEAACPVVMVKARR